MILKIAALLTLNILVYALDSSQVLTVSKGELIVNSSSALYNIDNITVFNIDNTKLDKSNLQATFTGWIQTKATTNLNKYESKIQIFNSANVNEKLLFFGNNSTHFILRQDISTSSSRCTCELQHLQSSTYRFIVSIQQNSSGLQLSLTLQYSDGSLQYCKQNSASYINASSKTYLIAFQAQKPQDGYIYSSEKMGDLSIIQNYAFYRDQTNSNLNEEKFLLWYNPSALQAFQFQFSYEQKDCNCIVDSSSNQIQAISKSPFGILESVNAGGYFIYTFTQNQEFEFQKKDVRFGQPMDSFYNSLNINNQSNSYNTMSLIFSFWIQFDATLQSFQIINYNSPNNQFQIKAQLNQSNQKYQITVSYQGIEYILTTPTSINPDNYYHIIVQINSSYIDLYINGIFNQRSPINLLNLFSQESSSGSFKIGGQNSPASSTGKLSQLRMFSSSSVFTNQVTSTNSLIPNCFTLVQERQKYTCLLCQTGYFLNSAGQCVSNCSPTENLIQSVGLCAPKCSYRCNTCSPQDPLTCLSCSSKRTLKGTTCLCSNGTFEDYKSLQCNSVKKLTQGFEIGQFTINSVSQIQVNFKNSFSSTPEVIFSILGYSTSDSLIGFFQVKAQSISQTSMTVNALVQDTSFYLQVQYFAYQPSKYFYSGIISSISLLSASGNYQLPSLGTYYSSSNPSSFNTHVFLGGYFCNPSMMVFPSTTCSFGVSVNSDKVSVNISVNSKLVSASPTIYYLITPPEISSFDLSLNYNSNSIFQDANSIEKYSFSQISLTPLNSALNSLNPLSFDIIYSVTNFNFVQQNFQYFKYQPNEITIDSSGVPQQNFEFYLNAAQATSNKFQATLLLEQFSDTVCGVKDFYTLNCLYCQSFGYDPSTSCTTCLNSFQSSAGNCITPDGYYYDSTTNSNLPCDESCSLCQSKKQCTQCKGQLVFNQLGLCACSQSNYWFDNLGNCSACDKSCATCKNSSSCTTCQNGLTSSNSSLLCECPQGQWFDDVAIVCKPCFALCQTCTKYMDASSQNCSTCINGRTIVNGSCMCSSGDTRIFQDETKCSQDEQAVLNIILSNNYLSLLIDFGIQIQPIFSSTLTAQEICQKLFDQQTLQLLGNGAQCSISGSQINIVLDGSSRVLPGDLINLTSNSLQFTYNTKTILNFYRNKVQMIDQPLQAQVKINNYLQIQNYCSSQTISLNIIANDGKRGFSQKTWALNQIQPVDSNVQQLFQQIINQANQKQSDSIVVFLPQIEKDIQLNFQVSWTLQIGQSGLENVSILIQKKKILSTSHTLMQSPPYYINQNIDILYSFQAQACDQTGKMSRIKAPLNIAIQNSSLGINKSYNNYSQNEIQITVSAYSMKANVNYNVQATITDPTDPSINLIENAKFYTTPSPLITKILGGNRYSSYQKAITIDSFLRDYEDQNTSEVNLGISIQWSCQNLGISSNCVNNKGEALVLESDKSQIVISKYTFQPYQALQINIKGTKTQTQDGNTVTRYGQDQVVIFVTELDIPVLTVVLPDDLITDPTINPNQLIHALMVYDPTVNTDVLYYSGAIIYNDEVVGVIKFDYSFTRFQIWDYFSRFSPQNSFIQVRFSVYNPQYVLPSLCTLNFNLNFPPQNCQINVNQMTGLSLIDSFQITLSNCQDDNSPIQYQFFYYTNNDQKKFELQNSLQIQRQQLTDKILENSVTTFLPGGQIFILAQAIDSKGAVSNSTITLNVSYKNYLPNEFLDFINLFIQNSQNLYPEQNILNLNILSQDILNREKSFSSIEVQLSQIKLKIIQQLQQISTQLLSASSFYQLADQTVNQLIQSKINLQQQEQSNQIQQIYTSLLSIQSKCEPSIVSQEKHEKCVQDTYLSFNILDSITSISQAQTSSLNSQYIDLTHQIGNIIINQGLPNENPIIFKGQNIQITAQQITDKNIYLFTGIGTNQLNLRRFLQGSTSQNGQNNTQQIEEFLLQLNNQTQVYDATYNKYQLNFYQEDPSFKNYTDQILNYTKKQADVYPVIDPIIKNNQTKQSYNPTNGVIHYFNLSNSQGASKNVTCFNKQNNQNWSRSSCSTRINEKTNQASCICNDLTPITIINDISDLFENNKNLDTVFSSKGFSNIGQFSDFYKNSVFWVVFIQTFLFICFILYGKVLDTQYLFGNIPNSLKKKVQVKTKVYPISQQTQLDTIKSNTPTDQPNINFTIKEEDDEKETPKQNYVENNIQNSVPSIFKLEQIQNNQKREEKEERDNEEQMFTKQGKTQISSKNNLEQKQIETNGEQIKSFKSINLHLDVNQNLNFDKEKDSTNKNQGNYDFSSSDLFENDINSSQGQGKNNNGNQINLDTSRPLSQQIIKQSSKNLRKRNPRIAQQNFDVEFLKYKTQLKDSSIEHPAQLNLQPNLSLNIDNKDSKRSSVSQIEKDQKKKFLNPSSQTLIPSIFQIADQRDQTPFSQQNQKQNVPSITTIGDQHSIISENDQNKVQTTNLRTENSKNSSANNNLRKGRSEKKKEVLIVQNDLSEEQKEKLNKYSSVKYYAHFHEFLSVFLVFNHLVSRPVRFVLFYLRYQHSLAISILFGFDKTFVQKAFISIASSLLILIFSTIIEIFLTANSFLKKIGVFLSIIQSLFYIYVIISIISGDDAQDSNSIFLTYLLFLVTDILVIQVLTALVFGFIAKKTVQSQQQQQKQEEGIIYKLFQILKLNIIIQAIIS